MNIGRIIPSDTGCQDVLVAVRFPEGRGHVAAVNPRGLVPILARGAPVVDAEVGEAHGDGNSCFSTLATLPQVCCEELFRICSLTEIMIGLHGVLSGQLCYISSCVCQLEFCESHCVQV